MAKQTKACIGISKRAHERLKQLSKQHGLPMSKIVEELTLAKIAGTEVNFKKNGG